MRSFLDSAKRTPYQSLASLLILFFTLFMALFFFTLTSFFSSMLSYVETRPQVTVYFNTTTKTDQISRIKDAIVQSQKALSVKYVSQAQALQIYRDLNRDNPQLLEMVSADILPASLEIYAKKPEYLTEIASFLKKQPGVDEVNFQKSIVDKLHTLTTVLRSVSTGIFAFLLFTSIIVLITTTAFKIALKKDEIELLDLLGASKFYIRKPFLQEGLFFGFVSGTASFVLFYGAYFSLKSFLTAYLIGIPSLSFYGLTNLQLFVWPPSVAFITLSYVLTIMFGMVIGLLGNYIATSKYI